MARDESKRDKDDDEDINEAEYKSSIVGRVGAHYFGAYGEGVGGGSRGIVDDFLDLPGPSQVVEQVGRRGVGATGAALGVVGSPLGEPTWSIAPGVKSLVTGEPLGGGWSGSHTDAPTGPDQPPRFEDFRGEDSGPGRRPSLPSPAVLGATPGATYFAGDEWKPANNSPADIGRLQKKLTSAGLLGDHKPGYWDPQSANAYTAVLRRANATGTTADRALSWLENHPVHNADVSLLDVFFTELAQGGSTAPGGLRQRQIAELNPEA